MPALSPGRTIVAYAESEAAWLRAWLGPQVRRLSSSFPSASMWLASRRTRVAARGRGRRLDRRRSASGLAFWPRSRRAGRSSASGSLRRGRARTSGRLPANVASQIDISLEQVTGQPRARPGRCASGASGTATAARRRCSCRRWRWPSRSSSRDTAAIARRGTGWEAARTAGLVEPGERAAFEQALVATLADRCGRGARRPRPGNGGEGAFSWERYTQQSRSSSPRPLSEERDESEQARPRGSLR